MYKPLLVNVSVSLIVSGVQPHMTSPHKEKTETRYFGKYWFSVCETETCHGKAIFIFYSHKVFTLSSRINQSWV